MIKKLIVSLNILLIFAVSGNLAAQNEDSLIDEEKRSTVEAAVMAKDPELLSSVLSEMSAAVNYAAVETYVLELAEKMILADEFVFAQSMAEAILFNNLENTAAQDLYTTLDIIVREKRAEEEVLLAEEERRLAEEEEERRVAELEAQLEAEEERKLQAKEEEQRKAEEEIQQLAERETARLKAEEQKIADEEAARLAQLELEKEEERLYYDRVHNIGIDHFSGNIIFGLGNLALYSSAVQVNYSGETPPHLKYGLSADLSAWFNHPYVIAGIEILFDIYFLNLTTANTIPISYGFMASVGTPLMNFPLYIRVGFKHNIFNTLGDAADTADVLITNFPTPTAGLGLLNIPLGERFSLEWAADFYFASLVSIYTKAAFDTYIQTTIQFYEEEKLSLGVSVNLGSVFVFSEGGLENNTKLEIGIGVGLNEN